MEVHVLFNMFTALGEKLFLSLFVRAFGICNAGLRASASGECQKKGVQNHYITYDTKHAFYRGSVRKKRAGAKLFKYSISEECKMKYSGVAV